MTVCPEKVVEGSIGVCIQNIQREKLPFGTEVEKRKEDVPTEGHLLLARTLSVGLYSRHFCTIDEERE
jgi:hypothetical protein